MNYELRIKNSYLFLVLIVLISSDQFSKYLIRHNGGFSVVCNKGIAFGINVPPVLFWLLWISIIIFLIFKVFNLKFSNKKPLNHNSYFIILIIAGAISNLIDRLRFGCVIDFIDLKYWPVFNFADIYITIGAILLVYSYLKNKNPRELG